MDVHPDVGHIQMLASPTETSAAAKPPHTTKWFTSSKFSHISDAKCS